MATQEIPRNDWVRFFNDYSRQHEGWLATVQIMGGDVGNRTEAHALPLHGVTYDEKGTGQDSVYVFLSKGTQDDETHTITHPRHIRIDNKEGLDQGLEIEADDGTKTVVRFDRPGKPDMVDRM